MYRISLLVHVTTYVIICRRLLIHVTSQMTYNRAVTLGGGVTKKENIKRKKMLILYMSIYFQQIT